MARKRRGDMGFRDLESFSRAMLAQLWKIITRPHSLVASFLKEKYFKYGDVLEAKTRNNASFMWRSILAAKELIKQGSRCQVGNGEKIKIWGDNWLVNPSYFQVQSTISVLGKEA